MTFKSKLQLLMAPCILCPVVLVIIMTFLITGSKIKTMQYEILDNHLKHILALCETEYELIKKLKMEGDQYYSGAVMQKVLSQIRQIQQPPEKVLIVQTTTKKLIYFTGRDHDVNEAAVTDIPYINDMITNKTGRIEFREQIEEDSRQTNIAVYAWYANWDWLIAVSLPKDEVYKYVYAATYISLVITAFFLMIVFLISYLISRSISKPLEQLEAGALKIAQQDYEVNIALTSRDEFGDIAKKFNLMAQKIREYSLRNRQIIKELQESENRFRRLTENAQDVIYRMSLQDGRYEYVSKAAEMITGYAADEFYKNQSLFQQILHPDWVQYFQVEWEHLLRGSMPPCYEYKIIHKSGEERWLYQRNVLVTDEHNNPIAIEGIITDITDRKRAEDALQREHTLLANIMETSPIGITTVDAAGQITFANPQAIKILGLTKAEIVQRTYHSPAWRITDFAGNPFPTEELPFVRIMTTGQAVYDIQHAIEWPDGRRVLLSINAAPLKNEVGQIEGMVAVLSDITERKQAEEAQRRLNRELRALSDCNQILLRAVDEQTLLNDICRIICEVAGYRMAWVGYAEHDEAKTVRPVAWAGVEKGYLANAKISWADTERGRGPTGTAIRTGEQTCIQNFMTDPQVTPWRESALQRGYHSSLVFPLKDDRAVTFGALNIYATEPNAFTPDEIRLLEELADDLAFGIVTLRTRAERKRAEAEIKKLLQAVEQSPAVIVITDPTGRITYVNPKFTQLTGYTPDEVLGKNPRILKSGETPVEEYQRLWATITHGDVWRGEFHNKKKTGDLYWESVSVSPVMDPQGNITHFVAVKEDITARKQAEEALRILNEELDLRVSQRTAELEAANKELKEFAYIVSHDLKAPLRGINRLTQWLREDYPSILGAKGKEQLDLLGEQVKRMDNLIDGILRYSRAMHGSEHEELVDLNTLVSQVIEMLMPPAHITIRLENTLPVIRGDPVQITQVFQNLLSNAMKFLDKPTGKIAVASEDAGKSWIFRVEDNGPGIEPRHHERIFKIFQSGTPQTNRDSTGIGLAVVKKIVEFYGGRVWVESTIGQGSRFYFTWPKRIREEG